ncbi:biotin--[acetyl-CoA-carboxylase] ligase [Psychrobacter sp. I-STPA10]|uniref:biotin--[acetyl-CoA-carboxylase] ligase n=1 Tax=Psychrobacter sp. I-STPA10 TaxID=2585769 RepID=UPI001E472FAF|nr:biotin--[acetyl-CoA-carboxylase] ligase [Psychrobacter sp. I-STPA10]
MPSLLTRLNHRHFDSIDSTNTTLINDIKTTQLESDLPHLLTASTQSAGRGQHSRSWQSPMGNVYLSLYYPYQFAITGLLSLIVGYELVQMPVITELNQHRHRHNLPNIGVKWANDVGFYDPMPNAEGIFLFNKLAGILIEPVWQAGKLLGVVIGVGLNVHTAPLLCQHTQEGMSYQAIGLADLWQAQHLQALPQLSELYTQIAQALINAMQRFNQLQQPQQQPQQQQTPDSVSQFLQDFAINDALAGRHIRVSQVTDQLQGKLQGIDNNGCLQLLTTDGRLVPIFTGKIDVVASAKYCHIQAH